MPENWMISAGWESMSGGLPEECACFAALEIQANEECLTEGRDGLANRLRRAPLLSAYHLAEWLAWNWWRLRWEPRPSSNSEEWAFAHRLSTIGGGYIWPDITIFSDGQRIALIAKSTKARAETPYRYISNSAVFISADEFEAGIDEFIEQVLERLQSEHIKDSNLASIWDSVTEERKSPELAYRRKLEALLGNDPDESDERLIRQLIQDARQLGTSAIEELAAGHDEIGRIPTAKEFDDLANQRGVQVSTRDGVNVTINVNRSAGQIPAWQIGYNFAHVLRIQEQLGEEPVDDARLVELLGVSQSVFSGNAAQSALGISFELDNENNANEGRLVLCSNKRKTGQRFDLARILGDRLINSRADGRLYPVTRAYTSRQQAQRAFAAELLSPFAQVRAMLHDDCSQENLSDIAYHFGVSELTIRTMLVNHGVLDRYDLTSDFQMAS